MGYDSEAGSRHTGGEAEAVMVSELGEGWVLNIEALRP